jgi:hypothetical protein
MPPWKTAARPSIARRSDSDDDCDENSSDRSPDAFADDGEECLAPPPLPPTLDVADADALFALFDHARCCPGRHASPR